MNLNLLNTTAKTAGILTLLIAVIAPLSMLYLPSVLIVPGDASKTAQNILASEELFRLGMIGDAIIFLLEVALTVVLYDLLKPVSKTMSPLAVFARVSLNDIQALNLLSSFLILQLRSNSSFLRVFTTDQLHAFMLLSLNAQQDVVLIWGLFLALHMFVLGYLVYQSGYLPKTVGALLMVTDICYLIQSFGNILAPQHEELFASIGLPSTLETAFAPWLLFKGINASKLLNARAKETT
jgi:Domain of unknown function (DUF4386)